MVVIDRWLLYRKTVSNDHLIKWLLCTGFLKNSVTLGKSFYKVHKAANNLTKLAEVGKHFTKLVKFANNFIKFVESANNFRKLAEVRKKFAKFVKLAKKVTKFMGFVSNLHDVR